MKTRLLRRLRKEAKKNAYVGINELGYAKVLVFKNDSAYTTPDEYNSYAYKEIEEKLIYYRRKYIMDVLEGMKVERMVKRLNSKV